MVSLLMFHFGSPVFTKFEFTKLIYLCIFIHLYFYFCTMFLWVPFAYFLYLVCKIFMVILQLYRWEVTVCQCDPAHVNLCRTCMWTNSDQLMIMGNPKKDIRDK